MYTNLKSVMAAKGISVDAMAGLLRIHRNTVSNKLDGDSEFTYGQAEMIQEMMFPEYNVRFLFRRDIRAEAQDTQPRV